MTKNIGGGGKGGSTRTIEILPVGVSMATLVPVPFNGANIV
jgi:hypothetical protein